MLDAQAVKDIAKAAGKEPAQVLLAWCTYQEIVVITKSVTESRIKVGSYEGRGR